MKPKREITEIGPTRTVSWTETRNITVCYHSCIRCGVKTPEPTTEQKLEFAHWINKQHEYMWPDRHNPGCKPIAWSWYESQQHKGWLCFNCTQNVNSLIDNG